jgi:hypothetical protein
VIEGGDGVNPNNTSGLLNVFGGEASMFWSDLSYANGGTVGLIDGTFIPPANPWSSGSYIVTVNTVGNYLPAAKIGNGNYIYVWSGGSHNWYEDASNGYEVGDSNHVNYFGIGNIYGQYQGQPQANMGLSVLQAFMIDSKIDDGLPQSGKVLAMYNATCAGWASSVGNDNVCVDTGLYTTGSPTTYGTPVTNLGVAGDTNSTTTCYDYTSLSPNKLPMIYSTSKNANRINRALSFQFQ